MCTIDLNALPIDAHRINRNGNERKPAICHLFEAIFINRGKPQDAHAYFRLGLGTISNDLLLILKAHAFCFCVNDLKLKRRGCCHYSAWLGTTFIRSKKRKLASKTGSSYVVPYSTVQYAAPYMYLQTA